MPLDPLNDPLLRAPRSHAPTIAGMTEAANTATPEQLADFVDAIGAGGGGGGGHPPTDLGATATPTGVTVTSSTGADALLPLATATNAGLMDPAQHTKLDDLPTAATLATGQAAQDLAISGKADAAHTHTAAQISDATAAGRVLLTAADAAAQRTALALGNVSNTADADKPVSAAQALAIAAATTAGAIADTLETAPAADLARIQASVSGDDGLKIPATGIPTESKGGITFGYRANGAPLTNTAGVLSADAGTGQRAWYLESHVPEGVRYMACDFSFIAGSGGQNGNLALIAWDGPVTPSTTIPPTSIHFTINRWTWSITRLEVANGAMITIDGGQLQAPLSAGVRYRVEICIIGDVAYLVMPDGSTQIVRHEAFARRVGTYASVEFYQFDGATDDRVQVYGFDFSADGRQGAQAAALIDPPLSPSYAAITSITSTAFPTAEADIEPGFALSIRVTKKKPRGILRLQAWLDIPIGQSVIFAPRFVRPSGAVLTQPYVYLLTSRAAGQMAYSLDIPMDLFSATDPLTVQPRWFCTSAGGVVTVAGNKPLLMSWFPAL